MDTFKLESSFKPTGDQPEAINNLTANLQKGVKEQVLLGVTGSGKTFTMANVIQKIQKPTLIISHNKTLAAQLYQEFRDFFPKNAVSYFVSYYDYYQPEAYIPQTDTYIEKETEINEEIDKLRLAATTNLLTRRDSIVVASVSCIYNIGSPKEYGNFILELMPGVKLTRESILERLIQLQYERSDYGFHRSTFRVRGDTIDVFPAYMDTSIRIVMEGSHIQTLEEIDPLTGKTLQILKSHVIYPAKHFMTDPRTYKSVFAQIEKDKDDQVKKFKKTGKLIEAQRIEQKVTYDLEMIQEMGYVNGIENYSRYFDGRKPGDPPNTLLDYYREVVGDDWLLIIDESHMTVPQIRGMYNGDRSRKQTLIDYGFRLPSALDNRPLRSEEFERIMPATVYVSATPSEYEISRAQTSAAEKKSKNGVVEQLIRPTGLVDPVVSIRPVKGQVMDLHEEIQKRVDKKQRVLVTTLTKQMAEDLADYLEQKGIKVHYLHSEVLTLERTDILADLRSGTYDVIVGVNLLREGLDLPEVSLVAILDADKEGFLRSKTSLVQTMGRAARHEYGEVILYADRETDSIKYALSEVARRREIQLAYNKKHKITPRGIQKPIRDRLVEKEMQEQKERQSTAELLGLDTEAIEAMTPMDRKKVVDKLTQAMRAASRDLDFEFAARVRDFIAKLTSE
jgi:excinuclease ABC subunit B